MFTPLVRVASVAAAATLAGCLAFGNVPPDLPECPAPEDEGPGFLRLAFYVRVTGADGSGERFLLPLPVEAASGEPAPILGCLKLEEGEASWRVVDEERGRFLEFRAQSGTAHARASVLVDRFGADVVERHNWTLAPLDDEMRHGARPPSDASPKAFPLGGTVLRADVSGALVRVYLAVDGSADDQRVLHRQDVMEKRVDVGWQPGVVFREFREIR